MLTRRCSLCGRIALCDFIKIFDLKGKLKRLADDDRNLIEVCKRCEKNPDYSKMIKLMTKKNDWIAFALPLAQQMDHPILKYLQEKL